MKTNKSAIVYYSNSGNTKKIVDQISNKFFSDVFEIKLEKPYGNFFSSILRYVKNKIFNKKDLIQSKPIDFSEYDTIFLGSPVWAGNCQIL